MPSCQEQLAAKTQKLNYARWLRTNSPSLERIPRRKQHLQKILKSSFFFGGVFNGKVYNVKIEKVNFLWFCVLTKIFFSLSLFSMHNQVVTVHPQNKRKKEKIFLYILAA